MEAAIDPLLCHYQGPISSLLRRDNMYSTDPSEVFTGLYKLAIKPDPSLFNKKTVVDPEHYVLK